MWLLPRLGPISPPFEKSRTRRRRERIVSELRVTPYKAAAATSLEQFSPSIRIDP
jgi:hypothetical protein